MQPFFFFHFWRWQMNTRRSLRPDRTYCSRRVTWVSRRIIRRKRPLGIRQRPLVIRQETVHQITNLLVGVLLRFTYILLDCTFYITVEWKNYRVVLLFLFTIGSFAIVGSPCTVTNCRRRKNLHKIQASIGANLNAL